MRHKYLKNVVTLQFDAEKCKGCRRCTEVCPHGVFRMMNEKAVLVDRDWCMECGACEKNCPFGAISVSAGVGCAAAIITGFLTGSEPVCGCGENSGSCC